MQIRCLNVPVTTLSFYFNRRRRNHSQRWGHVFPFAKTTHTWLPTYLWTALPSPVACLFTTIDLLWTQTVGGFTVGSHFAHISVIFTSTCATHLYSVHTPANCFPLWYQITVLFPRHTWIPCVCLLFLFFSSVLFSSSFQPISLLHFFPRSASCVENWTPPRKRCPPWQRNLVPM